MLYNLYFISQILYKRYKNFFLIRLLGQWQDGEGGQSIPIGGLAYYISPLRNLCNSMPMGVALFSLTVQRKD